MAETAEPLGPQKPLWQRRWFQILVATLVSLVVLSFLVPPLFLLVYELRSVLVPVLIALGLAYVVNPAITVVHRRYHVPRWAGAGAIMALGLMTVATFLLLALPPLIAQGTELVVKLKEEYPQKVVEWIAEAELVEELPDHAVGTPEVSEGTGVPGEAGPDAAGPSAAEPMTEGEASVEAPAAAEEAEPTGLIAPYLERLQDPQQVRLLIRTLAERLKDLEWAQIAGTLRRSLDVGVGVVGSAIGFTSYLMLAVVVVVFCFFFFAWKFDRITGWFVPLIPASHREEALRVMRKMDRSIAAFIRGRLVQAFVMMLILSVGWLIADVPYWLLLGVLSGVLNLIPFVAVVGWALATLLTVIDHTTGPHGFTLWTLAGPTLVYLVAQVIDGWVVEPVVQGKATNLDPITVLLVVLIGGSLAGLLGMLIAIPTAACVKILCQDSLLPRLRQLAAEH